MKRIENVKALKYYDGSLEECDEVLVNDKTANLTINNEIRRSFSVIEDSLEEFTIGYLFNENLIKSIEDVVKINVNGTEIDVEIKDKVFENNETILCSDSSGGCRTNIKHINKVKSELTVTSGELIAKIEELKNKAEIWQQTGGTHVAGLVYKDKFIVKEDVSRHVAVDKVIGYGILNDFDLSNSYVIYSGRMPADMVIKITRVGIPILASNAAPSLSGYEIAEKGGVTLVGFIRGQRFNVYNNLGRVIFDK